MVDGRDEEQKSEKELARARTPGLTRAQSRTGINRPCPFMLVPMIIYERLNPNFQENLKEDHLAANSGKSSLKACPAVPLSRPEKSALDTMTEFP
jgi:hypothetical protein